MGLIDYIFGGINFKKTKKGEVLDIIYPAYNKTNGWFCNSRWDLVTKVNKKGDILDKLYIWDYATVRTLEIIKIIGTLESSAKDGKVNNNE